MQALQFLDAYSIRARLFAGLIAGAPLVWLAVVLVPWDKFGAAHVLASVAAAVGVFALADLARTKGRRVEAQLYAKWGGKPSTTMLRLSDQILDPTTKERYRRYLAAQLKAPCPSEVDEKADSAACDTFYEGCGNWLRERTRDTQKFKLLFEENITYGFRRNLYGLKSLSIFFDCLLVVGGLTALMLGTPASIDSEAGLKLASTIVIALLHIGYFAAFVTETAVRDAAIQYGRQLLLSCETLGTGST